MGSGSREIKEALRREARMWRNSLPEALRQELSRQICALLTEWQVFREAEAIYFYYPLGSEADLLPAARLVLEQGKTAAFPRTAGEQMDFYQVRSLEEFREGAERISKIGREKRAVFITLGAKGAYYYSKEESGYDPGFRVKAVDTTGCGDSFLGAILYHLACEPQTPLSKAVRIANAVGALCAMKQGAFDAMPTKAEVEAFLAEQGA